MATRDPAEGVESDPLVGRGSAPRVAAAAGGPPVDLEAPAPPMRSIPRPAFAESDAGRWSFRRQRSARLALGVVLVAALGGAWAWVGRHPSNPSLAESRPAAARPVPSSPSLPPSTTRVRPVS